MIDPENLTDEQVQLVLASVITMMGLAAKGMGPMAAGAQIRNSLGERGKDPELPEWAWKLAARFAAGPDALEDDIERSATEALAAKKKFVTTTENAKKTLKGLSPEIREAVVAGSAIFDVFARRLAMDMSRDAASAHVGGALCTLLEAEPPKLGRSALYTQVRTAMLDLFDARQKASQKGEPRDPWDRVRAGLKSAEEFTSYVEQLLKAAAEGTAPGPPTPMHKDQLN